MPIDPVPVRSLVIDFDGTICPADVSDEVMDFFIGPAARELDQQYERGEIGSRENLIRLAARFPAGQEEALRWALDHHRVDPSFPRFVRWAVHAGIQIIVVSDGIGIHVEPMLHAAGIEGLPVISNRIVLNGRPATFEFPSGHPVCSECGACKMLAVTSARERSRPLAYVGDGHSDRYGALYSDLVFAKGPLAGLCRRDGIPYVEWRTFEDVQAFLVRLSADEIPGPVDPVRCPGWREPE